MPFTFVIDKTAGVIRETWTGQVDLAQLEQSCRFEWQHPDFSTELNMISDFRAAEANMSADEILQFASWFGDTKPPPKHAIVIARESGLALASMFSMIRDTVRDYCGGETRLFFSPILADRWIAEVEYVPQYAVRRRV